MMSRPTRTLSSPLLSFLFILSSLSLVYGQFIDVPSTLDQCKTIGLTWLATASPYTLSVLNGSTSLPLEQLSPTTAPSAEWTADVLSGSSVLFQLQDGEGLIYNSSAVMITAGSGACMANPDMIGQDTLVFDSAAAPGAETLTSVAASSLPSQLISATLPTSSASSPSSIDPDDPSSTSTGFSGPVYSAVPGGGYVPVDPSAAPSAAAGGYGNLGQESSAAGRVTWRGSGLAVAGAVVAVCVVVLA